MAETKEVGDNIVHEGVEALLDRLGCANAARFIAMLGGEGDSVEIIRERRRDSTVEEIVERIRRREK